MLRWIAVFALAVGGLGAGLAVSSSGPPTVISTETAATLSLGLTATVPTVTETQTVTETVTTPTTTTTPEPPAPSELGSALPDRMPESDKSQVLIAAPGGSSSSACTLSAPCNVARAFVMATSGTVIYARGNAGVYGTQSITGKTYDPANPVTFTTYPGDAIATFAGPATQPTTNTNGVYFVDITGLRIRHLKFNAAYGVSCLKVDSGIHVELDDVLVQDCGKSQVSTSTGGWIGAISVLVGGGASAPSKDFQVWNSRVFNWRDTENNPGHNHGFYFASVRGGGVFNTVIYNDVRGGGYGIQMGGSANDMTIANNTIDGLTGVTGGGGSGITVWLGDPTYYGAPATSGNLFVNNLFTNNVAYGVEGCGSVPVVQNVVRNNLTFSNALGAYRPAGCKTPANAGTFVLQAPSYSASPLYVDRAAKNFHLASDSPARGKSEPDYTPTHDADGIVRPAAPALGAFN